MTKVFDTLRFNQALVDGLTSRFPVHILSDNYRENIAYISQRYHFDTWTEQQFYSFSYRKTKSDRTLFESVVAALDLPAQDILFIDDDPDNIRVAASLGIRGICYQNNAQLWKELDKVVGEGGKTKKGRRRRDEGRGADPEASSRL